MLTYGSKSAREGAFAFMPFLIPVLVGLMVLPVSVTAPAETANAAAPAAVASSTTAVAPLPAPKLTLASAPVSLTTKLTA